MVEPKETWVLRHEGVHGEPIRNEFDTERELDEFAADVHTVLDKGHVAPDGAYTSIFSAVGPDVE
jgi:hypothetical protein